MLGSDLSSFDEGRYIREGKDGKDFSGERPWKKASVLVRIG